MSATCAAPVATRDDPAFLDRGWRAANFRSVGQIYLLDHPLLTEPLDASHVTPRLLGPWGTTPGLDFVYAHLNRLIRARAWTRAHGEDRPEIAGRTGPA